MLHENTKITRVYRKGKEIRFELENSTPRTDAFMFAISEASSRICEQCGKPSVDSISWKSSCEEHI